MFLGGTSLAAIVTACSSDSAEQPSSSTAGSDPVRSSSSTTSAAAGADCAVTTPPDMAGPYPADGSNGPDVLSLDGVVREDLTTSFAGMSGIAGGVAMSLELRVLRSDSGCVPLQAAAVYVWHCDDSGDYSLYSESLVEQNYLRGVQESDDAGRLSFTSIFPGCYPDRWPHIHFEVYDSIEAATSGAVPLLTSQIALPADAARVVYETPGYEVSAGNFSVLTIEQDGIFNDGWDAQMATADGDAVAGFTVALDIVV